MIQSYTSFPYVHTQGNTRKSSRPEPSHIQIYDALKLPHRPGKTIKTIL